MALCDYEAGRAEACQRYLRKAGLPPADIYSGEKGYEDLCSRSDIDLVYVATDWLCERAACPVNTQISREIDYFKKHYEGLHPAMFLSYEREAYYDRAGGDFRVTFDHNILCRQTDISLCNEPYGYSILPADRLLMEIKCPGAIPLWMVNILSEEKIYKTSFSKYGTAYIKTVLNPDTNLKELHR